VGRRVLPPDFPSNGGVIFLSEKSEISAMVFFEHLLSLLGWVRPLERDLEDENLEMRFEGNSQAAQLALSRARRSK